MTDEVLDRATRAFRKETAGDSTGANAVFERIESSRRHAPRGVRRARMTAFAVAAFVCVVAAVAGATGMATAMVRRVVELVLPVTPATAPDRDAVHGRVPSSVPRAPGAPKPAPDPAVPEASVAKPTSTDAAARAVASARRNARGERAPPNLRPTTTASADDVSPETAPPEPPPIDVDALYRAAHEAQFRNRDYAGAVAAWDAYLAHAPPGSRMLIEARYNRGIALARLGRAAEAVQALEPFANGDYGMYRRDEARRVIEKMRR